MKLVIPLIFAMLLISAASSGQYKFGFDKEVAKQTEYALELCKYLHQNPESR